MTTSIRAARRPIHAILASLLAVAALTAGGGAQAATATRLDFNIAVDPGAEAATGGTGAVVPIPLWATTSTMTAVAYGSAGFPTLTYSGTIRYPRRLRCCVSARMTSASRGGCRINLGWCPVDSGRFRHGTELLVV